MEDIKETSFSFQRLSMTVQEKIARIFCYKSVREFSVYFGIPIFKNLP